MSDSNNKLIWHDTAINLIQYADKYKGTSSEFECLVGYLLLDVGVETLLRSFLMMSGVKTKSDKPSFPDLIEDVKRVAGSKISEVDLEDAKRYHNFRNKIYHQGDGLFPGKKKFEGYLQLGGRLLDILLDMDKTIKDVSTEKEYDDPMHEMSLIFVMYEIQKGFQSFQFNIGVSAEIFAPKYTSKRFEKSLKEIQQSYPDNEDDSVAERY